VAEQVPFNKKDLVVSKMQVSIKSPKPSIDPSIFYNWTIFQVASRDFNAIVDKWRNNGKIYFR
jgi:hypothetical protein